MPSGAKKLVYDSQLYWDQKSAPLPGIEPGPPGWEPEILATRPQGIMYTWSYINNICW